MHETLDARVARRDLTHIKYLIIEQFVAVVLADHTFHVLFLEMEAVNSNGFDQQHHFVNQFLLFVSQIQDIFVHGLIS